MKTTKKVLALIVVMMMVLGMTSAYAATITVVYNGQEGATDNTEYTAYKIFDYVKAADSDFTGTTDDNLGPGTGTGLTYSIAANSPWYDVVVASGYFTLNGKGTPNDQGEYAEYYVSLADTSMNTAAGAKTIAEYLRDNKPSDAVATEGSPFKAEEQQPVEDGYYLITSTLGELVIAATSDIQIKEKNPYPTLEKEAEEGDYAIGDHVPYTITVTIPANVDNDEDVTVHDELAPELHFEASTLKVSVTVGEGTASEAAAITTRDEITLVDNPTDDCTFELVIDTANISEATTYVFTYTAELLSTADADGDGYVNKAFLGYSDYETKPSEPKVYTYDFSINKVFTGSTDTSLVATFNLKDDTGTAILLVADDDIATDYVVADSDNTDGADATITVANGATVKITGLKEGTYTLTEVTTDTNYNLIEGDITVTFTAKEDGTMDSVTFSAGDLVSSNGDVVTITNNNGTVLPSTGGMGTTMIYVVGTLLVLCAGVVLISKRRVGSR